MAIRPEDVLRAIAAARGEAICVPTMTTAPAWREIAPDDLSIVCQGFMGGASTLGLGDRKSTRLNSSHSRASRMPSSA